MVGSVVFTRWCQCAPQKPKTVPWSALTTTTTTAVLRPFFWDHPGEPVPEENFWTLWCKGRLTEAETPTIWLGATLSGLTSAHLHHPWSVLRTSKSAMSSSDSLTLKTHPWNQTVCRYLSYNQSYRPSKAKMWLPWQCLLGTGYQQYLHSVGLPPP